MLLHLSVVRGKICQWSDVANFFQFLATDFAVSEFTDSMKVKSFLSVFVVFQSSGFCLGRKTFLLLAK